MCVNQAWAPDADVPDIEQIEARIEDWGGSLDVSVAASANRWMSPALLKIAEVCNCVSVYF